MRILLVTPLYPPDIAVLAPYTKELATRLSKSHTVEMLTYGHIPETISGVTITSVEKSSILPVRLFRFFIELRKRAKVADVVYTQNGPSVELPILALSYIRKTPIHLRIGDDVSYTHSRTQFFLKKLLTWTASRARSIVVHDTHVLKELRTTLVSRPHVRPEILPLAPYPKEEFADFEHSWEEHCARLVTLFSV